MGQRMVKLGLSIFYAAELGVKSQKKNLNYDGTYYII